MSAADAASEACVYLGITADEQIVSAVVVDERGDVRARGASRAAGAAIDRLGAVIEAVVSAAGTRPAAAALAAATPDAWVPEIARLVRPGVSIATLAPGAATMLGERWYGAAQEAHHAVALSIGTSVHAGILMNDRAWLGANGLAGSAAWLALNPVEREDYRRTGCLEAEVGAAGIVRRLVWRVKAGDRSRVAEAVGDDLSVIVVDDVFDAAREGDGVAISVVRDTAKYVGMAVANLAAAIDPEIVILGGLLATHADLLIEPVKIEAGRRLSPRQFSRLAIVASTLGDEAAALGAARFLMPAAR